MLNRLIIAVFGLSLVFALGSVVLAGPGQLSLDGAEEPIRFIPNHPKLDEMEDARPTQPSFKKPASALRALPFDAGTPAPPSQSYFCDMQAYAGPQAFYWTIPDAYGDDLFNTRFTVEDNFECTLKVAWILSYDAQMTGSPDMRVYLWDDDGFGFPGSVLDSVDIPNATLVAAGFDYVAADFSAAGWVFADGDEYHYGVTPIGGPGDGIAIISDDADGAFAGEERSSEFWNGAWGTMLNDWGLDYTFDIISERCCEELDFSDCYSQTYAENLAFFWRTPHPVFGDSAWAQRFDVGGPETLQSVDIAVYDPDDGSFGNDIIYATVYDDDGSGQPGAMIAQVSIEPGSYAAYPAYTTFNFSPLVLENTFHVAFSSSGEAGVEYESCLSSNGADGVGRSNGTGDPDWAGGTTWYTMLEWWGADVNFLFDANLCRDQFADCSIQNYFNTFTHVLAIPDGNPVTAWAQRFVAGGGSECELRELEWCFYRHPADSLRPDMYEADVAISITDNVAGSPGAVLHTEILTAADFAAAGYEGPDDIGSFILTMPALNVIVPASFFVTIEPLTNTQDSGVRVCVDGAGGITGFAGTQIFFGGNWLNITAFGFPSDAAMYLGAKVCCTPFEGAACEPPDLWTTQSRDFGRTGASNVPLDDAWCDLTTSWLYETPANTIPYMSPIIHDGRVYVSTSDALANNSTVEVLDLISGAHLYTISDADFGNFIFNDPTIYNGILYVSGGSNTTITGWDISTTPATKVLSRTFTGTGPLRFANIIVLDIGGTEVLFAGSEIGKVVAIEAATGDDYVGWDGNNPLTLAGGQLVQGSASDGSSLYYGTNSIGLDGDVFSVDAASGTINWRLSEEGGLQGAAFHEGESGDLVSEGFYNISFDAGKLFVGARMTGDFPRDGMYYTLDAASGALINAIPTNGFLYSNPIVDVNLVYCQTITGWSPAPYGTPMFAAAKSTGGVIWSAETPYVNEGDGRYWGNGVRSCEPEDGPNPVDIVVNTDEEGAINFWNSLTGEQIFRRRWDFGQDISDGAAATLATDSEGATHLLVTNGFGAVVDLVKGADRPRLEIQGYDLRLAVDFSVDLSVIVTVADALVNTGCADLTFNNVNTSDVSNGSSDPNVVSIDVVRPEFLDRSSDLANQLASSARYFKGLVEEVNIINDAGELSQVSVRELALNNERFISRSATSSHPYLNGITQPVSGQVLVAGASLDLLIDVNPSEILRGPQTFYIELDTDDPDFFVNAGSASLPSPFPEIRVTLIGGCLTDSTSLTFGLADVNTQIEWNNGTLSNNDAFSFDIDGEDAAMWLGSYIFGIAQHRLAMTFEYFGGDFTSWQADPNWYDISCKPALTTGVILGEMWDGDDYSFITGNTVYASGIDSVQNHDFGDGWDWENNPAPFSDDQAMGLSLNSRTIGVPNVAELSQFTLEIFDFTERNGVAVPGWKFGYWCDYDIYYPGADSRDTSLLDPVNSVVWQAGIDASNGNAWGAVKVPFGCGYSPAKNVWLLDSDNSFYATDDVGAYLDLFYSYSSDAPGEYSMPDAVFTRDQSMHATLAEHDFAANETYSFGVAIFRLSGLADAIGPPLQAPPEIAALANTVNKWAGFGRGDVDNDNKITIADIMTLVDIVSEDILGAIPFKYLADVDGIEGVTESDITYLVDYYFNNGPCPIGDWTL